MHFAAASGSEVQWGRDRGGTVQLPTKNFWLTENCWKMLLLDFFCPKNATFVAENQFRETHLEH